MIRSRLLTVDYRRTIPQPPLLMLIEPMLALCALVAIISYVLVCRVLAVRTHNQRLVRRFTVIMWTIVTTLIVMFLVAFANAAGVGPRLGRDFLAVPALAAVSVLLAAAVTQFVASFQLSPALRKARRHWSELAAVPDSD